MLKPVWAAAACSLLLSGCAVAMAANQKGVDIETASACNTRACFLALRDIAVMTSATAPDGTMTETYKILLHHGSVGRAAMHGVLDVATFGVWEVAGTPIEGSADKSKFVILTAKFDRDGKVMQSTLGDRITNATRS